jgi:hypothetical protein
LNEAYLDIAPGARVCDPQHVRIEWRQELRRGFGEHFALHYPWLTARVKPVSSGD